MGRPFWHKNWLQYSTFVAGKVYGATGKFYM